MYCDACGAQLQDGQNFCRACGKPVGGVPAAPLPSRLGAHLRLLGILWLAISGLRLLPAACTLLFGHFWMPYIPVDLAGFVRPMVMFFGAWIALSALVGFLAGWGLLARQPWARALTLVLGCLALLHPPFGTALGIYTLWVLLPSGAAQEYRRMARVA